MPGFGVAVSMAGNAEPGRWKCGMDEDRAVPEPGIGIIGIQFIMLESRTRAGSSPEVQEGLK